MHDSGNTDSGSTFGEKLRAAGERHGRLCVGIDPHKSLLESWGFENTIEGLVAFSTICVDAFAGHVALVKPQVAFYEAFGSDGFAVLETTMAALRSAGTLVVADAKRGDIGSTMAGYAEAWLTPGSPLGSNRSAPHLTSHKNSVKGCLCWRPPVTQKLPPCRVATRSTGSPYHSRSSTHARRKTRPTSRRLEASEWWWVPPWPRHQICGNSMVRCCSPEWGHRGQPPKMLSGSQKIWWG